MNTSGRDICLVAEVVKLCNRQEIPVVRHDDTVDTVIEAFARACHSRLVYVVNDVDRLSGVISLGSLARHLLFYDKDNRVDNLHLTSMAMAENAEDFVDGPPLTVHLADRVDEVIDKMITHKIKEVPVIDDRETIVADITLVDLLKYCKHYFLNND